jgi:hypothetical protein
MNLAQQVEGSARRVQSDDALAIRLHVIFCWVYRWRRSMVHITELMIFPNVVVQWGPRRRRRGDPLPTTGYMSSMHSSRGEHH